MGLVLLVISMWLALNLGVVALAWLSAVLRERAGRTRLAPVVPLPLSLRAHKQLARGARRLA